MEVTISSATLTKVGLRAIQLIRKRTLAGEDDTDTPFKPYSTRPFVMPAGSANKGALAKLIKGEKASIFKTKSGATWALIEGGYKALRGAMGKKTDTVNLSLKGSMLRSLTVVSVSQENRSVQIGFTDTASATVAYYHNVAGAGKGKTKRHFLGLSPKDLQDPALMRLLSEGIDVSF